LVAATRGAALIMDYGQDRVSSRSLRAISKHTFVPPLSRVGDCDLTADVDFQLLREAASDLCQVSGPINQSDFLQALGITERKEQLLRSAQFPSAESKRQFVSGYDRLIGQGSKEMGTVYKMMALSPKGLEAPYPFQRNAA
jgi:NADH dehydrogenase [ubiquinone] 1 alpha subcomplex assembly factor 7